MLLQAFAGLSVLAYCQAGLLHGGFEHFDGGYGGELELHGGFDGGHHEEIHVSTYSRY